MAIYTRSDTLSVCKIRIIPLYGKHIRYSSTTGFIPGRSTAFALDSLRVHVLRVALAAACVPFSALVCALRKLHLVAASPFSNIQGSETYKRDLGPWPLALQCAALAGAHMVPRVVVGIGGVED